MDRSVERSLWLQQGLTMPSKRERMEKAAKAFDLMKRADAAGNEMLPLLVAIPLRLLLCISLR